MNLILEKLMPPMNAISELGEYIIGLLFLLAWDVIFTVLISYETRNNFSVSSP